MPRRCPPRRSRQTIPCARLAGHEGAAVTRFVIDAPTLLHLVAEEVLVAPAHQLVAPQLLRSQALALLFDAVRRQELTERVALEQHEALTAVKVRLLGDRVSRRTAWQIARDHGLDSTADARSEEHTSELQSRQYLVCRLLL